jgi:hypothetical protein
MSRMPGQQHARPTWVPPRRTVATRYVLSRGRVLPNQGVPTRKLG